MSDIGAYAFSYNTYLEEVVLPDTLKTVGDYTFFACSELTHIEIPDSVEYMGYYIGSTFEECRSLESISLGAGVVAIGPNTFGGCGSLTSITIPETVTYIGDYAFAGCGNLKNIEFLPSQSTIEEIGEYAFDLTDDGYLSPVTCTVKCGPDTGWESGFLDPYAGQGTTFRYLALPPPVRTGEDGLSYVYDTREEGKAVLTITGEGEMTAMYRGTMYSMSGEEYDYSNVTDLIIGEGITVVNHEAFRECSDLVNVTLPSTIMAVLDSAFSMCWSLKSITIPEGTKYIGASVFYNCLSLVEIKFLPKSIYYPGGGGGIIQLRSTPSLRQEEETEPSWEGVQIDGYAFALGGNYESDAVLADVGYDSDLLEDGFLNEFIGSQSLTTFVYHRTIKEYKHITQGGKKLQVDSAIRDANGMRIDTTYGKKVETYNLIALADTTHVQINHTLGDIPSAVLIYLYEDGVYERIEADVFATQSMVGISFEVPLGQGTIYRVKIII